MPTLSTTEFSDRSLTRRFGSTTVGSWSPLLLRLIVGYGFLMHGYAKWLRGPDAFAVVLHTVGVPLPHLFAWLTTVVELVGGVAVLIGAFIPIVSVPMAVVLFTAMFTIHLPYGFFSVKLVEVTSTDEVRNRRLRDRPALLAALGALALEGRSSSVDRWRARRRQPHDRGRPDRLPSDA